MVVEYFMGRKECNTIKELEETLKLRNQNSANEFIISEKEKYYPYLAITVRDDLAVLNYMEEEGCSYIAIGGEKAGVQEGSTLFHTCSETDEMEMDNYYVLRFCDAQIVAKEFFEDMTLPKSVEWDRIQAK